ncbi:MAG: CocE/NonD family hydrolase [Cyanobacteria bacterium P01_A01_bin.37]
MFSVCPKETVSMQTRDGVRLDADVYRPDADETFPVLLMRQPYGRAIASTVVYAHPIWYAAHGYIVVIQDVRGRGSSEGDFRLFANDIEDGEDTVYWASNLSGSNGQVGMYGFSYQGMTQLYAAANRPTPLKTICPAMLGYDLYADWAYEGGALCLQASIGWAMQLAAETARRDGNVDVYNTLYTAARTSPTCDPVSGYSKILNTLAPDSFYHDWLAHPEPDSYWEMLSPRQHIQDVDMPMLHIGGWYDTYLRGTIRYYREMAQRSHYPQQLWIGPWGHIPWGKHVGEMDFGAEANSTIDSLQIQWFDQFLKGKSTPVGDESPVHLFEMGSNRWRSLSSWPSPSTTTLFLNSTGLAGINDQAGKLTDERSPTPTHHKISDIPDTIVHDPWRPVPSKGGHASVPSGPMNRAAIDCRSDVLTYTSAPLIDEWQIAGDISVDLTCTSDAESFDLCAVLSNVYPDGRVMNITQGYQRILCSTSTHDDIQQDPTSKNSAPVATKSSLPTYRIQLQPTCISIPRGHALRLSLSGANFPAHPVNSGHATPPSATHLLDADIITIFIWTGTLHTSKLLIPGRN